jgi:sugar lactone lactonase YvrE
MQESELYLVLPDYCPTPDGMAIAPNGDLILACPNFADQRYPGCIMRITKDKRITKWFDVPVLPETGLACPMGIAFGENGDMFICDNQGWTGNEAGQNKGRLLRLTFDANNKIKDTIVVAYNMEHPNGVRVRKGKVYVTQSMLTADPQPDKRMRSGVYRFDINDRDIEVKNTLRDPNLIAVIITQNEDVAYGADGLDFDNEGNLYIGNFGDGAIHKLTFDAAGNVLSNDVWAKDLKQMRTTDGICFDSKGNLWVADFSDNAVAAVSPTGKVSRIAQSPDSDGSRGELDQPGEPIEWNGMIIVSCFDLVTGPDKVNTGHQAPHTLVSLKLNH